MPASHLQLLCVLVRQRPPYGIASGQCLVVREGAVVGVVHRDGGQWSHLQWPSRGGGPFLCRSTVHRVDRLGVAFAGAQGAQAT